jgi:hypothetical protein
MTFTSIMFSLFIIIALFIVVYQCSLTKTSLKDKTTNQLLEMRLEAFIDYKQAKAMKLYGIMGHRAQIMCNIDKALSKKRFLTSKTNTVLVDTVKLKLGKTHKVIQG